ncbi:unnamed protein product [Lampetra planeri]
MDTNPAPRDRLLCALSLRRPPTPAADAISGIGKSPPATREQLGGHRLLLSTPESTRQDSACTKSTSEDPKSTCDDPESTCDDPESTRDDPGFTREDLKSTCVDQASMESTPEDLACDDEVLTRC